MHCMQLAGQASFGKFTAKAIEERKPTFQSPRIFKQIEGIELRITFFVLT